MPNPAPATRSTGQTGNQPLLNESERKALDRLGVQSASVRVSLDRGCHDVDGWVSSLPRARPMAHP